MKYKALMTRKVNQYQEVEVEIPDDTDPVKEFWRYWHPGSRWRNGSSSDYYLESLQSETEIIVQDGEVK